MLVADLAPRKTKIVATLGPASVSKIPELILAGTNVFRLNFSHIIDPETQTPIIHAIRSAAMSLHKPVAILGDLGGPKIRCNDFKAPTTEIPLVAGTTVILEATEDLCETCRITTCVLPLVAADVQVLLDLFETFRKTRNEVTIDTSIDASDIYACTVGGDGEPPHLPWRPFVISKIEKPQALDAIDDIIALSDGIMVARGDLGVEISLERVPIIQKMLIHKANAAEKPVITATQMLESMINSPVPTRAEVSDVANAVLDGTDAVMLSGEYAVGKYPIETVSMMSSIFQHAEAGNDFMHQPAMMKWNSCKVKHLQALGHPIADAAIAAAHEAHACALIVFTYTGDMAYFVSKRRPNHPIVAITHRMFLYRRLALLYGVFPVLSTAFLRNGHSLDTPMSTEEPYLRTRADVSDHGLAATLGIHAGNIVGVYALAVNLKYMVLGLDSDAVLSQFGNHIARAVCGAVILFISGIKELHL
ncbi:pyruvate kinase [Batrachochytrium salamandrivorans]|nr:pyruvate kinase [Batrachochytrium salamandrivorans]